MDLKEIKLSLERFGNRLLAFILLFISPNKKIRDFENHDQLLELNPDINSSNVIDYGPIYRNLVLDNISFASRILIGARFINCSLRNCDFGGSDLSYVRFEDCDLYRAIFSGAVLYACWFKDTELTKAIFSNAYMSGFRLSHVDITHAVFGEEIVLGKNRKSFENPIDDQGGRIFEFGEEIVSISDVEARYSRLAVERYYIGIILTDDPPREVWRKWRRQSEICKIIKRVFLENGYFENALNYYYLERTFLRKSMQLGWGKFADWFFGDLLWGYGVKWQRSIRAIAFSVFSFAAIYLCVPLVDANSGIQMPDGNNIVWDTTAGFSSLMSNLGDSMIFSIATTCLYSYADLLVLGWAKLIVTIQVCFSVLMISLLVAGIAKRLANI